MAQKRKHQEPEPQEAVHESRQFQVYGNTPKPVAKKPRKSEPVYKKQAHATSVNAIKKRVRDVTRRLERAEDLPADVRIQDERALAAYQQELAAAEAEKIRQKMIKKYHMVRFFERQKATRQLKKLRKLLLETQSTDEVETLKAQMHIVEVDLNYTQYFPLSEVYISLYPPKNADKGEDESTKEEAPPKPLIWAEVEKCIEEGTLNKLRNRVPDHPATVPKPLERRAAKPKPAAAPVDTTGLNRRERRSKLRGKEKPKNKSMGFAKNQAFGVSHAAENAGAAAAQNDDDDSDGGFFEG